MCLASSKPSPLSFSPPRSPLLAATPRSPIPAHRFRPTSPGASKSCSARRPRCRPARPSSRPAHKSRVRRLRHDRRHLHQHRGQVLAPHQLPDLRRRQDARPVQQVRHLRRPPRPGLRRRPSRARRPGHRARPHRRLRRPRVPVLRAAPRHIFPAITERYRDQVRIVYRDFPLEQHPWAMRAAVDVNCLAAQSPAGYWNVVDYIHAHAGEIGTPPPARNVKPGDAPEPAKTLDLRQLAARQARPRAGQASRKSTRRNSTPASPSRTPAASRHPRRLGDAARRRLHARALHQRRQNRRRPPFDFIFNMIDHALIAEGKTPPPPYVAPTSLARSGSQPASSLTVTRVAKFPIVK